MPSYENPKRWSLITGGKLAAFAGHPAWIWAINMRYVSSLLAAELCLCIIISDATKRRSINCSPASVRQIGSPVGRSPAVVGGDPGTVGGPMPQMFSLTTRSRSRSRQALNPGAVVRASTPHRSRASMLSLISGAWQRALWYRLSVARCRQTYAGSLSLDVRPSSVPSRRSWTPGWGLQLLQEKSSLCPADLEMAVPSLLAWLV